jgi:type I restriction enzyme S subunit
LVVTDETRVLPRYLLYLLQGYLDAIHAHTSSVTVKHLSSRTVLELPVPLPPLGVQDGIVEEIEKHFTRLDAAERSLRSASARCSTYEASVINHLLKFEGADANAVALRDVLREPLKNGKSARKTSDGGVRCLTLSAVTKREFSDKNTKLIGLEAADVGDLWLQPGDVFVQRSNTAELVGSAALYKGEPNWAIYPDLLIRVRVDTDRCDPRYLDLVLQSDPARRYFRTHARGIAGNMPKIAQPVVEGFQFVLPSLSEQLDLLGRAEALLSQTGALQHELRKELTRVPRLKESVLASAYVGRLLSSAEAAA